MMVLASPYWNSMFLRLPLITEAATEKASQFILPLKSANNKKLCFNDKNVL